MSRYPVNAWIWIAWTIEIFPSILWVLHGQFPARRSRFRVSHHATCCARRSLTSYWPVVCTWSHFDARFRRRNMLRETARAPPQVPNILTACEPMGLSSRSKLLLLASQRMALTRESKNASRIAREIEILSILALSVPTWFPKHNSRFRVFCRTICWSWWSINVYETFGRKKIAVSFWNAVSAPC